MEQTRYETEGFCGYENNQADFVCTDCGEYYTEKEIMSIEACVNCFCQKFENAGE